MRFAEGSAGGCPAAWVRLWALLKRAFAILFRQSSRDTGGNCPAPADLARISAELRDLNGRTERYFLEIGERLSEFAGIARHLSADMAALSELVCGKNTGASQILGSVLGRLREMESQAGSGDRKLADLCASARQVERAFTGFANTVAVFRVLASMTRIEASRLGQAGGEFGDLAEEVQSLAGAIESSGQSVLEASLALQQRVQAALVRVTTLHGHELKELPALVEAVMESLGSFQDRQRRAGETSRRGAADYRDVSSAIADLITAIQFHDITRQQIEHVADALDELHDEAQGHLSRGSPADRRTGAVLALQSSQLSNTGRTFLSAVDRMERDLDRIGERVVGMADSGRTLMGVAEDEQDSFFLQMESRFTAVLKIAGKCAEVEVETQATLADLTGAAQRMEETVDAVRQIGNRIHRIAINAAIRAEHIGKAGHSLAVVAESMQRLALQTNQVTSEVAGVLGSIREAAGTWSGGLALLTAAESSGGDVCSAMRGTILKIHSASEAAFGRIRQIGALSRRLGDAIRSARAGFSAGPLFAGVIEGARSTLGTLSAQALQTPADGDPAVPLPAYEAFASRYTMQAERDVHESVAAGEGAAPLLAPVAESGGGDLGENVELF
jgi:methyl-accepting chemotaxis protein